MALEDTVVQGSRVQKEASKRVRRQASLRFSFSQPWCESTMQTQKAKRTDPEGPMHTANTVVALTVHTAFVPSQRLRPRTTGSTKCKNLRRFRVDLDYFLSSGPTGILTLVAGFKVQSANHYTIRPRLSASMVCTGSSAQHCPSTPASPPAPSAPMSWGE